MATIKFDDFLQEELKNDEFKAGYLAEKAILESALAIYNARQKAGLTQRELADLSHVPQSTIARIERGNNTSIETMSKIAYALIQELTISIG
ncbi:TPA: helix-turn-helix transcriptional regulator [Streptococcus suis]|nr:helix-turn-helix transcriptional regulator [Streptococcus suis]HEM5984990.1 helix-turn-helix transcriptional regulator [Streptococcus suis]